MMRRISLASSKLISRAHSFSAREASLSGPVPLLVSIFVSTGAAGKCEPSQNICNNLPPVKVEFFLMISGKDNLLENVLASKFAFAFSFRANTAFVVFIAGIAALLFASQ